MVTLERALFDTNEALHQMGVISADKYITESSLMIAMLIMFLLVPLMVKLVDYTDKWDSQQKYTPLFVITSLLVMLYITEGIFAVLILLIVIGFYIIIATYPQYRNIHEYIDKFF